MFFKNSCLYRGSNHGLELLFVQINSGPCCYSMNSEERDINELFDDIVLTEERNFKESYEEGLIEGRIRGNIEGYQLGYAQGVQLGEELGEIYGTVVAHLQQSHSERVHKTLLQLRQSIDIFPRFNDPEQDIIAAVENIRTLNKRMRAMLRLSQVGVERITTITEERKDYSF